MPLMTGWNRSTLTDFTPPGIRDPLRHIPKIAALHMLRGPAQVVRVLGEPVTHVEGAEAHQHLVRVRLRLAARTRHGHSLFSSPRTAPSPTRSPAFYRQCIPPPPAAASTRRPRGAA